MPAALEPVPSSDRVAVRGGVTASSRVAVPDRVAVPEGVPASGTGPSPGHVPVHGRSPVLGITAPEHVPAPEPVPGHPPDEPGPHPQLSGQSRLHHLCQCARPPRVRAPAPRPPESLGGAGNGIEQVQGLPGLEVPVHGKDRLRLHHDRAGDLHGQVLPRAPGTDIATQPVGGVNNIVAADKGALTVDDKNLAVVAQVRTTPAATQGQQRHCEVPLDTRRGQATPELVPAGVLAASQVVQEKTDGHAPLDRARQGRVEGVGDLIPALDVELHVDVAGGGVDRTHHGGVGGRGVRVQGHDLPGDAGQAGQAPVHPQQRAQGAAGGGALGGVGQVARVGQCGPGGGDLLLVALALDPGAAQEEVQRQAHERQEEDEDEPGGGAGRAAVLRDDAQGHDLDRVLQHHPRSRRQLVPVHGLILPRRRRTP